MIDINCKTSPFCSHNTNGRDLDKPCSIEFRPKGGTACGCCEAIHGYKEPNEPHRHAHLSTCPQKEML